MYNLSKNILFVYPCPSVAGRFLDQSGQSLQVSERYKSRALKYAELYRRETGNYPTMELVDKIRPSGWEHLQKSRGNLVFE